MADIFVVDTVEQTTERIVVHKPTGGVDEPSGYSLAPSISADGRYVVFDSLADNFVPEDKNFRSDIFLYDRLAEPKDRLTRISETADGTESNRDSFDPTIHADGKLVAFITRATSLDPTDNDTKLDVFLKNWQTGELVRVSRGGSYSSDALAGSFSPMIAGNGQSVIFASDAQGLITGDTDPKSDIFIRDLSSDAITSITVSPARSLISAERVTIAHTTNSDFAVAGGVSLTDALLAGNDVKNDLGYRVVTENSLDSTNADVDLIGPLTR